MQDSQINNETLAPLPHWRGLGAWNLYFLAKFALLWMGVLNFHAYPNLVFAAALVIPLPPLWLHKLRNLAAIPVGAALFYYDTWLPPVPRAIQALGEISGFSRDYLLEIATRVIDLSVIGGAVVLLVAYLFLSQWLRATFFTVLALLYISVSGRLNFTDTRAIAHATVIVDAKNTPAPDRSRVDAHLPEPTSANLEAHLQAFYRNEEKRRTVFTKPPAHAQPFDVLILNICSLAWSDLDTVKLRGHPLFAKMDVVFDNFNSATSYSAPAGIRMLRASCGQTSHSALYSKPDANCFLFDNLRKLGYTTQLVMNHDGIYGDYLDSIRKQGNLPPPAFELGTLPRVLNGFDGTPIRRDIDVLKQWLNTRQTLAMGRTALFYNTITLHDGNRYITADGGSKRADYLSRAQTLLGDLDAFLKALEKNGRPTLVMIVPEHGAALHSDGTQIAGMREIPSRSITTIPVAIKLIGAKAAHPKEPIRITSAESYLALSEITARLMDGKAFSDPNFDWTKVLGNLPQTESVAESTDTVVMLYGGLPYIRLAGSEWQDYEH